MSCKLILVPNRLFPSASCWNIEILPRLTQEACEIKFDPTQSVLRLHNHPLMALALQHSDAPAATLHLFNTDAQQLLKNPLADCVLGLVFLMYSRAKQELST